MAGPFWGEASASLRLAMAALTAVLMLGMANVARADGTAEPMSAAELRAAKGIIQEIPIGDGARLDLRKGYAFVAAADVPAILRQMGVADPSAPITGAVTSEGAKPTDKNYWISVITLDPLGHVPETGAEEISSATFLDSVKAARPASPALEAFAVTPSYDKATTKLNWAEQFAESGGPNNLRHEQRLLGRDSVIGVTTYGPASARTKIEKAAADVFSMVSFAPGRTYKDYAAGDRKSEYDLPGLITGKRRAGPLAETAGEGGAAAPAGLSLASFAPGGQFQWAPWLLGGIVILGALYILLSKLRKPKDEDSGDANITPPNNNANAV